MSAGCGGMMTAGAMVLAAMPAMGQGPRQNVRFEISQTTVVGQSVFVLGDLPELGGGDIRKAVKLDPSGYPAWRVTVSLPAGRGYTYQYYLRNDQPGQGGSTTNGTAVGTPISASTLPQTYSPATKTVFVTTDWAAPVLWWRQGSGAMASRSMVRLGKGRTRTSDGVTETRWLAWNMGQAGREIEFYVTDAAGTRRMPAVGTYKTTLDAVFMQDDAYYTYAPAAAPAAPRRDYNTATPPGMFSTNLNETRKYRVFLPRGYDQHPQRRYPVLYMHDGQNVFEVGPFGSWNAAGTITTQQRTGTMREVIVVAVDNGPNRLREYLPPGDTISGSGAGWADRYARFLADELKPVIDGQYRTLTGRGTTGALGSSMGGVVSLYLGWDFGTTFGRVGLMSGAWWTTPNFLARVKPTGQFRDLKIYMDSGDSGTSNDDYWNSYGLRDALVGGTTARYTVEGTLRHVVGYGQQHNEAAWAARLPGALAFLYPADEETNQLLGTLFGPQMDVNGDGVVEIEDLYEQAVTPRDLNLDGVINGEDRAFLEGYLRRDELEDMKAGRR